VLTGNGTGHPSTRAVNSGSGNRALVKNVSLALAPCRANCGR